LVDFEDRLEMTRLAFPDLIASEVEKTVHELAPEDSDLGTVDFLEYMKAHPQDFEADVNHISLVLGADTFNDFFSGKWKNADKILDLVDAIHVFERKGVPLVSTQNSKVKLELGAIQDSKIQILSSTRIREDKNFARAGVHPAVFDYMMRHHLY
jgi:nicotinic acid mononucleotide adenylyltransferase